MPDLKPDEGYLAAKQWYDYQGTSINPYRHGTAASDAWDRGWDRYARDYQASYHEPLKDDVR